MTDYDLYVHGQNGVSRWHLDKRVPIAFIVTIIAQTFVFGWMASDFNSRVNNIENYIAEAKVSNAAAVVLERDRSDRLVRLETMIGEMHRSMLNIERKIEQLGGPSFQAPQRR
jgi:hypothetical protein